MSNDNIILLIFLLKRKILCIHFLKTVWKVINQNVNSGESCGGGDRIYLTFIFFSFSIGPI